MATKKDDPIKVELDISRIRYDLDAMVREEVKEAVADHMKKAVEAEVSRVAKDEVAARIKTLADAVVAEGWSKTDEYGREQKKVTVKDLMLTMLTQPDRDSWGSRAGMTFAGKVLETALAEAMNKGFAKEIKEAQEKFKKMLDDSIQARLTEAIRKAFGMS